MSESLSGQIILINKPYRWTSFDVVRKIKHALIQKSKTKNKKLKVGHAGTLDPLATGLLILCSEKMTKKIPEIQGAEKEYEGSFFIGATTPSHDLETEVSIRFDISHITDEMIYDAVVCFKGEQMQTPPSHSAVKVSGKRAYELARQGKAFTIEPRKILIKEFEIKAINMPYVHFRIICSKGTYIRALADDFGKKLNSGAHLSSLCRTRIGNYLLKDALDPDSFLVNLIKSRVSLC
jgi:tRNA pseudouridine55 synthase